ncbi:MULTISPECIES: hypothetical protein [Anaerolinea]|uniref:hypothetical protein n=1 Tax=Anaerolinea TaxID=233189 RepID=UPI0026191D80|nr:hypothetical protein [Anaerolinea thermophila]
MNDNESRGNLYLFTGLILGLAVGLLISLVISPVEFVDIDPSAMGEAYRNEYRLLIAQAFQSDGNLQRARERLALLREADPARSLAMQAQQLVGEGASPADARALALLAAALTNPQGIAFTPQPSPTLPPGEEAQTTREVGQAIFTPTPPLPTRTPVPTFTPRPTATPMRALDAPFVLESRQDVCDGSLPAGRLVIEVFDRDGNPMAGVPVQVVWGQNQTSLFYTGLAPEISPGYADFQMEAGVVYTLRVGAVSDTLNDLSVPACGGGVRVVFREGR